MSAIIIYPNEDGGISIVHPVWTERLRFLVAEATVTTDEEGVSVPLTPAEYRFETDQEVLDRVRRQAVPEGSPYLVADTLDLPEDTSLRSAWTADFTGAPINS